MFSGGTSRGMAWVGADDIAAIAAHRGDHLARRCALTALGRDARQHLLRADARRRTSGGGHTRAWQKSTSMTSGWKVLKMSRPMSIRSGKSSCTAPQECCMTNLPAALTRAYMTATRGLMNRRHSLGPMISPRCWPQSSPKRTQSTVVVQQLVDDLQVVVQDGVQQVVDKLRVEHHVHQQVFHAAQRPGALEHGEADAAQSGTRRGARRCRRSIASARCAPGRAGESDSATGPARAAAASSTLPMSLSMVRFQTMPNWSRQRCWAESSKIAVARTGESGCRSWPQNRGRPGSRRWLSRASMVRSICQGLTSGWRWASAVSMRSRRVMGMRRLRDEFSPKARIGSAETRERRAARSTSRLPARRDRPRSTLAPRRHPLP